MCFLPLLPTSFNSLPLSRVTINLLFGEWKRQYLALKRPLSLQACQLLHVQNTAICARPSLEKIEVEIQAVIPFFVCIHMVVGEEGMQWILTYKNKQGTIPATSTCPQSAPTCLLSCLQPVQGVALCGSFLLSLHHFISMTTCTPPNKMKSLSGSHR